MMAYDASRARGHYNDAVRRYFSAASHAGDFSGQGVGYVTAAADEGGAGARIRLSGRVDNGVWAALRYRIFGCPHLIAAAEAMCERFEGCPADSVRSLPLDELLADLEVPVEKTGRLLLLEDAFRRLADRQAEGLEKPGSGPQH